MKQIEIDEDAKRHLEARAMLRRMTKVNPAEINQDVSRIERLAKELEQAVDQYSSRLGRASRDAADCFIPAFRRDLQALLNRIAYNVVYEHERCMPPNLHTDSERLVFDMGRLPGTAVKFDAYFLEDKAVEAYLHADERSFHHLLGACQRMVLTTTSKGKGILMRRVIRLFMREYDYFNDSVAAVSKLSNVLLCGEKPAYTQERIRVPPREETGKGHIGKITFPLEEPIANITRFKTGLFLVEYNNETQARAMAKLLSATQEEADDLWHKSIMTKPTTKGALA